MNQIQINETEYRCQEQEFARKIQQQLEKVVILVTKFGRDLAAQYQQIFLTINKHIDVTCNTEVFFAANEDGIKTFDIFQFCKSEEFYKYVCGFQNTASGTGEVLFNLLKELKGVTYEIVNTSNERMEEFCSILGENSKLYQSIKRFVCLGNCTLFSLIRGFQILHAMSMENKEEKDGKKTFFEMKKNIMPFIENLLKEKEQRNWIKREHISVLMEYHTNLQSLTLTAVHGRKLNYVTVSHMNRFFARFIMYCIGSTRDSDDFSSILPTVIKVSGYPSLPKGHAELKNLRNRIITEKNSFNTVANESWTEVNVDKVSIYAIADEVKSLNMEFHVDTTDLQSSLDDDIRQCNYAVFKDLINMSNFIVNLQQHLQKLIDQFRKHSLNEQEFVVFKQVLTSLNQLACISCSLLKGDPYSVGKELVGEILDYAKSFVTSYGCCQLENDCAKLVKEICGSRGNLRNRLLEMEDISRRISFFMVDLVLKYSFNKMIYASILQPSNNNIIFKYIKLGNLKVYQHDYKLSLLLAEYSYDALKEMIDLSSDEFQNQYLYKDNNTRFKNIVLYTIDIIEKIGKLWCQEEEDINQCFEEQRKLDYYPGILELRKGYQNFVSGACIWEFNQLLVEIETFRHKDMCNIMKTAEECKGDWKDEIQALITMREIKKQTNKNCIKPVCFAMKNKNSR